jgi:hypothetical protein
MKPRPAAPARRLRPSSDTVPGALALLVVAALAGFAPVQTARAQGVHAALAPTDSMVTPGAPFELHIEVTEAGSLFNAYDAVVEYDPAALAFLPMSPLSLQEGSYMKTACGSTFHRFVAAGDSLTIAHSLLCYQLALPGPRLLYRLRFLASTTPQYTHVRFRTILFYNARFHVHPVYPTDALVRIGSLSDVGQPVAPGARLRAAPNPFNPTTTITVETSAAALQALWVRDVAGRPVRLLQRDRFGAGTRTVVWDGRDDHGRGLPSGVYLVMLQAGAQRAAQRIVLVR